MSSHLPTARELFIARTLKYGTLATAVLSMILLGPRNSIEGFVGITLVLTAALFSFMYSDGFNVRYMRGQPMLQTAWYWLVALPGIPVGLAVAGTMAALRRSAPRRQAIERRKAA